VEREADELLADHEATLAARAVMDFVVDDVSNWYVRLSRARFYEVDGEHNRAAFATLYEVLVVSCRLLAPFAPFLTDWIHRELTGASVHLASYRRYSGGVAGGGAPGGAAAATDVPAAGSDVELESAMAQLRKLATLAHAARDEARVRVRQPLSRLVCVVPLSPGRALRGLVPLLMAELNVKRVEFAASGAEFVRLEAKPSFRMLGKRFGKRTPLAAQAIAALSDEALRAFERGEEAAISIDGESHTLGLDDLTVVRRAVGELVVKEDGGYVAALDPAVTPELRREGLARELVSRVQRMRKDAGLAVSDRIVLRLYGNEELERVVQEHRTYISAEVLAGEVIVNGDPAHAHNAMQTVELDGLTVTIAITRVD
jgi:isoleucyl-tRNA synthetase